MQEYIRREKVAADERESNMQKAEQATRLLGGQFDEVSYALNEINKSSPALASQLRQMVEKRVLERDLVVKFFSRGQLSQKAFGRAINEFGFIQKFGEEKVPALARMLTNIGREIPMRGSILRSTRDSSAEDILNFLVRSGLVDDTHRNGACVGLIRAKY
jgi:hypothetical protein